MKLHACCAGSDTLAELGHGEVSIGRNEQEPGVHYALTSDGVELPVVDVSHPAFALTVTDPAAHPFFRPGSCASFHKHRWWSWHRQPEQPDPAWQAARHSRRPSSICRR